MSWDTEKTISFIKEYEKRPILWKKNDKHYYNIIRKEDAWREIGEICNESVDVLKKEIDSLRGSRRREKNRIAKSMGTGKGRNEIYESKWFAWDSLKFLDDPEELQETLSNHPASSDIIEVDEETTDNTDRIVEDQNPISSQKKFLSPHKNAPKRKKKRGPSYTRGLRYFKKQNSHSE
ncbi:unnamed protein product [Acanthoscelides obtectus]|uniref:MADF domain-containing protein n=1 Tax=Acanthoscelides obtectus TaxID=200917 RepID=A0A9P0JUF7_ACAOB|nr:unnamed protein product [Acanthoscelides obtectus]CAK1666982.1 hypothetical protein AOBTE_LOCUS25595 [Acanthoscelides obtectus]